MKSRKRCAHCGTHGWWVLEDWGELVLECKCCGRSESVELPEQADDKLEAMA